jgi:hypothetical protein
VKKILITLLLFCSVAASAQHDRPTIAVYSKGDMGINELRILNTEVLQAIVRNAHYQAIERSDEFLAVVNREIVTQRFNDPDDALKQIAKLADRAKAQYVGVVDVIPAFGDGNYYVSARIVNIKTNFVNSIGRANGKITSIEDIMVVSCEVAASMFDDKSDECVKMRSGQIPISAQQARGVSVSPPPPPPPPVLQPYDPFSTIYFEDGGELSLGALASLTRLFDVHGSKFCV